MAFSDYHRYNTKIKIIDNNDLINDGPLKNEITIETLADIESKDELINETVVEDETTIGIPEDIGSKDELINETVVEDETTIGIPEEIENKEELINETVVEVVEDETTIEIPEEIEIKDELINETVLEDETTIEIPEEIQSKDDLIDYIVPEIKIDDRTDLCDIKCFKSLIVEHQSDYNPDILKNIKNLNYTIKIVNKKIVEIPIMQSKEGQVSSGYQLNITGIVEYNLEYAKQKHSKYKGSSIKKIPYNKASTLTDDYRNEQLKFTKLFSSFIVLPFNFNPSKNIEITATINDNYYKVIIDDSLYISTYIFLMVSNI